LPFLKKKKKKKFFYGRGFKELHHLAEIAWMTYDVPNEKLLSDAIRAGDVDLVRKLIEKDPGFFNMLQQVEPIILLV
jgi:ATP/maltotriose-dependent transcriptional regulator MalT